MKQFTHDKESHGVKLHEATGLRLQLTTSNTLLPFSMELCLDWVESAMECPVSCFSNIFQGLWLLSKGNISKKATIEKSEEPQDSHLLIEQSTYMVHTQFLGNQSLTDIENEDVFPHPSHD